MKKIIAAFFVMLSLLFSLGQQQVFAQSCITTMNQGAATVVTGLYEQSCATISYTSGTITKDVTYNCCGPAPTIRVNGNDWETLRKAGKLDGLRYQKVDIDGNNRIINFKIMNNGTPTLIDGKNFFQ